MPGSKRRHTTISIPHPLFEKIEELIDDTGFNTVSAFVTYVMRQVVADTLSDAPMDDSTQSRIRQRLKALGYI